MRCAGCGQELFPHQTICPRCGYSVVSDNDDSVPSSPIHASLTVFRVEQNDPTQRILVGTHELTGQEIIVGRLPSCDITLEGDSLVSRRHVRLFVKQGHYHAEDLASSNQTFLNGSPLSFPVSLVGGETISVGLFEIYYEVDTLNLGNDDVLPQAFEERDQPEAFSVPRQYRAAPVEEWQSMGDGAYLPTGAPASNTHASGVEVRDHSDSKSEVLSERVQALESLVRQRTDEDALLIESLRGVLLHTYGVLSSLLDARESTMRSAADRSKALVSVARETANDPEDLGRAFRFANHAGEIAAIMEYLEQGGIGRDAFRTLRDLQGHLASLPQVQTVISQSRSESSAVPLDSHK